jgi:N-acetylated-alpha-linked acidic dipeptidase
MKHTLLSFLLCAGGMTAAEAPVRGFAPDRWAAQRGLERKASAAISPERIGQYMERMSAEPHHAGSPGSRAVADFARELFHSWGYEARIETFEALLPYPKQRLVELVSPAIYKARLAEPAIPEDPDSADVGQVPVYHAYSGDGDVTAELVYVNYGLPEDYEVLKRQGIDVRGKIVIARYGGGWRGTKPKVAFERGAVGCLVYSDPRDDGYFAGDVYPKGPFRPAAGAQRGSVMDMPLYVGDPLSPGWSSKPGARKLPLVEARTAMKIPVQPLSYEDARPLLETLGGAVAPEAWRGALPITYHFGPGPAKVRLKVESDFAMRPVHNVIATMRGSAQPDDWLIYGNHHDAWVNGAQDPASGAAVVLETARVLGELRRQGWQPRRTLIFALWDAEEFGLVGSTEWVEEHREELAQKAVVYLNSDTNGRGTLSAGGSFALEAFVEEIARELKDPVTGKSLLDQNREKWNQGSLRLSPLGAGSDYVAFVHHVGIASLNLGFSGGDPGGIYHSIYDSMRWYRSFSDGRFEYGKALAALMATALLRLSEASLAPFEFGRFVRSVKEHLAALEKRAGNEKGRLDFLEVASRLRTMEDLAKALEEKYQSAVKRSASLPGELLSKWNREIYQSERLLLSPAGLPGRPWYKHQITAPGIYTGYSAYPLPGVREAIEAGKWDEAAAQMAVLAEKLGALNGRLDALGREMQAAR